jgi:hypothetical protein
MSAPEDITKQKSSSLVAAAFFGASDVTRTRDLLITSGILCVLRRFIVFVFA